MCNMRVLNPIVMRYRILTNHITPPKSMPLRDKACDEPPLLLLSPVSNKYIALPPPPPVPYKQVGEEEHSN